MVSSDSGSPPPPGASAERVSGQGTRPASGGRQRGELIGPGEASQISWLARTWWTVAGLVLVIWALRLASSATMFPWVVLISVVAGLWGLGVALLAWVPGHDPTRRRWMAWTTLLVALVAFGVWAYLQIYAGPGYGTDEMAFDQFAAHLLLHGLDPYRYSMAPAIARYHVSPDGFTYRLNGQPVTTLSYPALAFLFYVPLLVLGWSTQAAAIVNIGAWMVAVVLLFAVVPPVLRPVAIVLGSLSVYVSYAVGGVTDALFVPFLIGAVVAWDRSATERGWRSWRSPILMGLALAVKQTPWFVLVFLLTAIFLERHRTSRSWREAAGSSGRYLAISLAVFLLPNLWFIASSPSAWVHGVLAPFGGHVVPAGQGLIGLSLFLGIGGGSVIAYTLAAVLVLVSLWVVEIATWPTLRAPFVLLPSLVLFFATRSLGSYLVELLPAALAAAVTIRPVTAAKRGLPVTSSAYRESSMRVGTGAVPIVRSVGISGWPALGWRSLRRVRWGPIAAAGTGLLALGGVALALASPSPLGMQIVSVHTTGQLATVDRVVVRVENRSELRERPHFSIDQGGSLTTFWSAEGGPAVLAPGASATYTLLAPNAPAMPPIAGGFQVLAFTEGPDTVSRTAAYLPTRDHLLLSPQAMSRPVLAGQTVTIHAELLNPFDQPLHKAGVPVYMGQIIYEQRGPQPTDTMINGSTPGKTPVMALTDSEGVATFMVQATAASSNPVYYEANLVDSRNYYPYGYSPILIVYFDKGTS